MDIIGGAGWFKTTAQVNEKPVITFHCRNKQFQTLPQQKTLKRLRSFRRQFILQLVHVTQSKVKETFEYRG